MIKFLSEHTYVILPTKANPKVYLPIADKNTTRRAFELYNPFSNKAKILKRIARLLCLHAKPLARILFSTVIGKKSNLLLFLEKELSQHITSSAYLATAKDKIVLQLQNKNSVIGYLKYPISNLGKERLQNEQKAIALLSSKKIIPPLTLTGQFDSTDFIVLKPIEGEIGSVSKESYKSVLNTFKNQERHPLESHPRVRSIRAELAELNFKDLNKELEQTLSKSREEYLVVYEHGDFAPWNLITTKEGVIPFDFEYFEEIGLEHFDEVKFHFQEQHLLYQKDGKNLISAIASKVALTEFKCIFHLFLLKEIVNKTKGHETVELELQLIKQLLGI